MSGSRLACDYPSSTALGNTPVESAVFHQWRRLRDDELLEQAGLNGFTTLVTTDNSRCALISMAATIRTRIDRGTCTVGTMAVADRLDR